MRVGDAMSRRDFNSQPCLAIQYLEPGPHTAALDPGEVRAKLRLALEQLPLTYVVLGWVLPPALVDVCQEETARAGAQLFLWHPLLTGDGVFMPRPEWQTVGLGGEAIPGFQAMPEFTFVCPNHPEVQDAVLGHLHTVIQEGAYDGVFLDRIRYPSPAVDPARWLACFCPACRQKAASVGLDLVALRQRLREGLADGSTARDFLKTLLGTAMSGPSSPLLADLKAFLDFRARSVTQFIQAASDVIRAAGLSVGLDCFSPSLTYMVGQDLAHLGPTCDWVKVMTYGHAYGPATLPFELLGLLDWLTAGGGLTESQALSWLAEATQLPLPQDRAMLRHQGLAPGTLALEAQRARWAVKDVPVLAGIELVEIPGIAELDPAQVKADVRALSQLDGFVLSWDLWHMPPERLKLF